MTEPWELDLADAAEQIRAGRLGCVEVTRSVLNRIEATEPRVRAFVSVDADRSLRTAAELDRERKHQGVRGPLHGIPVGIKDIFDIEGQPTRCGCAALADAPNAKQDSTAVARLRAAGAIPIGKTTTHELACGVYTPPTSNPWDLERIPGGSSGGSGAAVAAGAVFAALGSDTGGSIRIPAALCGVTGIKPTYGLVSREGVAVLSWSLDHVGPLARTTTDAALVLDALAGVDGDTSAKPLNGRRLGVPTEAFFDRIQPAVAATFDSARTLVEQQGATVLEISIPELRLATAAEFDIVPPEAASYHSRLMATRAALIGDGVRGLLEAGAQQAAIRYLDAQRARAALIKATAAAFDRERLDALFAPTLPATAAKKDQQTYDFDGEREAVIDAYVRTTCPFNLTGLPVVAVPAGLSPDGLPIGVQFAARSFQEATAVELARAFEQLIPRARPPL